MIPFGFALYDSANTLAACFLIFSFFGTAYAFLRLPLWQRGVGFQARTAV